MYSEPPHDNASTYFYAFTLFLVFVCVACALFLLSSCQYIPQVAELFEKVTSNDMISFKCDKDCFHKDADVKINVEIVNQSKEIKE